MKYALKIYILIIVSIVSVAVSADAYEADVEYISARDYFKTALREISKAQVSIDLFMFVVSFNPNEPKSKPARLLKSLVEAKKRGVEVNVYLDQNVDLFNGTNEIEGKNNEAVDYIKMNGLNVYMDDKYNYSHSKALVIDKKIALIGSSNWSRSAFNRNQEANILVRSEKFAKEILDDLASVKRNTPAFAQEANVVKIPKVFAMQKDLLGQMVTQQDERAFDIYLWLLMKADTADSKKLSVNYDGLAKSLGIGQMTREDYRRQISKVLRKIEGEYGLIKLKIGYDEPADVVLVGSELNVGTEEKMIHLPEAYWQFGWNRKLNFPGKVMLLLNRMYSDEAENPPTWHIGVESLAKKHGISETFIGDGIMELRKYNLVDVRYEAIDSSEERPRQYGVYSPNEIYDPRELEKRFNEINLKEGEDRVQRAREYAEVVFKQNDYEDVLTLIGLEKLYGKKVVEEAVGILNQKRVTSPKRHMGYLVGTIKGIAEQIKKL